MIVLPQTGVAGFPVHAALGQGVDGAGLDTLAALLAGFDQAQLIGSDQGMVTQVQIRDQAAHAAATSGRSDELAIGAVATQADQVSQVLVGPQAYQPFLVEVVCGRGEGRLSPGIFDLDLHGTTSTIDHVVSGGIGSAPAQGGAFAAVVIHLDVSLKGNEPDHHCLGTGQKVLGKGVIRYGNFFQPLEPIVGRGTGHDGLPPDGNLVVFPWVGGYVVNEPLGKIVEGHVCIP